MVTYLINIFKGAFLCLVNTVDVGDDIWLVSMPTETGKNIISFNASNIIQFIVHK
jgi:hypothetical protein